MITIYLDETSGLAKVMESTQNGEKLISSFGSVKDFCNAFAANAKLETPIVPPSCFKYLTTEEGRTMFLFYPAKDIVFQKRTHSGGILEYNISIPNTVIKADLSIPSSGHVSLRDAKIYFTDSLIPTTDMKLYKPPFPNVYEDCKICFGGVSRGAYNEQNLFGIDGVYSMFFNNVANNDLFRGETIKGSRYQNPESFLKDLSSLPKEDMLKVYFENDKFKTIFSALTIQ